MKISETLSAGTAAAIAGGIPESIQNGIIQIVVGCITALIVKLLNRYGKKKEK